MYETYVKKYQEEKEKTTQIEEKFVSLAQECEAKFPLIAAQKNAYEELVFAYKEKMTQFTVISQELAKVNNELQQYKIQGQVAPVVQAVPIQNAEDPNEEERMKKLIDENERLKYELKLLYYIIVQK